MQKEILDTLEALPIGNKTILKDSKILTMVEKWSTKSSNAAEDNASTTPAGGIDSKIKRDSDVEAMTPNSNSGTPLYDEKRHR